MVNATSVRAFRVEDLHDIMEIEGQAFPKSAYPKALMLEFARNHPTSFIVAETGSEVVGYVVYDEREGHIFSMAVKPSHRRRGLGKMMFMRVRTRVEGRLWLEVRSKNSGAIRFYESMGMTIRGKVPQYYETDDALIMTLEQK